MIWLPKVTNYKLTDGCVVMPTAFSNVILLKAFFIYVRRFVMPTTYSFVNAVFHNSFNSVQGEQLREVDRRFPDIHNS